ncbi:MAG: thioredoxin TrxC [Burkholderiales bacterium]
MPEVSEQSKVHLACPSCMSENRVPSDRLGDDPKCGKCGVQLLEGKPVSLNEQSFDAFLKPAGLPVVVDFWAPWCGPCRAMAPAFEQAAQKLATSVRFAKLNTDEAQQVAGRFAIRSIPTLVLFRGGQEVKRTSGAMDTGSLIRWINN